MSKDKEEVLGQVITNIYPGGRKETVFKGKVTHNDIFSMRVSLQRGYAIHLNKEHNKNKKKGAETARVAAEKAATEKAKKLQIEQEKEREVNEKASAIKIAEAKVAELKTVDVGDLSSEERTIHRAKFNKAKEDLRKLSK